MEYTIDIEAITRERDAMQNDVKECLGILKLGDHARPTSPHLVMQDEIIPTIAALVKMRDGLLGNPGKDMKKRRPETVFALRDAEDREVRGRLAAVWWEIIYASHLDQLVDWLAKKLRRKAK